MWRAFMTATCIILLTTAPASGGEINWQDVSLDLPQPEMGMPFPDFELPDITGGTTAVSAYRGKPLFVIFCACYADTSCSAVRAIENLRAGYGESLGIVVVCSEVAPSWRKHGYAVLSRRTKGLVDAVLIDEEGKLTVPYLVSDFPTTYLVDGDFITRYRGTSIADFHGEELTATLEGIADSARNHP